MLRKHFFIQQVTSHRGSSYIYWWTEIDDDDLTFIIHTITHHIQREEKYEVFFLLNWERICVTVWCPPESSRQVNKRALFAIFKYDIMNAYNNNPRDIFDREVKPKNLSKYLKEINFLLNFVNNNLIKADKKNVSPPSVRVTEWVIELPCKRALLRILCPWQISKS